MKIDYIFYVVIIAGLGYLIYKDQKAPVVQVAEKMISLEENVYELNRLLLRRDSIEDPIIRNITKIEHHWHTLGGHKIDDKDSLLRSVNELLITK